MTYSDNDGRLSTRWAHETPDTLPDSKSKANVSYRPTILTQSTLPNLTNSIERTKSGGGGEVLIVGKFGNLEKFKGICN